jgi:uncharacterized membrane protein (DUF106 family)
MFMLLFLLARISNLFHFDNSKIQKKQKMSKEVLAEALELSLTGNNESIRKAEAIMEEARKTSDFVKNLIIISNYEDVREKC